jgi:hypothetical protein
MAELACAGFRLPLMKQLAAKVFFGRGSFPDVEETSTVHMLKTTPLSNGT